MSINQVRTPQIVGSGLAVALTALVVTGVPSLTAQSLLDRSPNVQGTWVGTPGTVFFHTMHRFVSTGPPSRKLQQTPTFLMGGTLPGDVLVGANYSTNSAVRPGLPNEWEFFARYTPFRQTDGPVDLAVQAGFNQAALSWDGQLTAARRVGPVRLILAGRAFSNAFEAGRARFAVAAGGVLRVTEFVALAGDYGTLVDRAETDGRGAWSAGVQLAIPYTPHTLSLHASNSRSKTLEGASVGEKTVRYGFEFTVPITLSRYFGSREAARASPEPADAPSGEVAVEVGMTNRLQFTPDTVRIEAGETVRWRNTSALLHTVTADPDRAADAANVSLPDAAAVFDSGDMAPESTFEYTFTVPGTYKYFCIPHEVAGMVGWVIVSESGGSHDG